MEAPALGGEIRAVSPSPLVRALRILAGVEMLSTCVRGLLRLTLRSERRGEIRIDGAAFHILERRSILGRALGERRTLVPVEKVVSVSLFDRRAELLQSAGLSALAAGTLVGTGLFAQGLRTPGLAPSLLGLGLILAAAGGLLDFALDRAALRSKVGGQTNLRIVPARGPGILLTGVAPALARVWLEEAQRALAMTEAAKGPGAAERAP